MTRQVPQSIIDAAILAEKATGVPAPITLAQWIDESGWGAHIPPGSNNYFGIKARPGEPFVSAMTDETIHGVSKRLPQNFAKFISPAACFISHANLLAHAACYHAAMLDEADPIQFAHDLEGVYATDKDYDTKLINLMQTEGLLKYHA